MTVFNLTYGCKASYGLILYFRHIGAPKHIMGEIGAVVKVCSCELI